MHVRLKYPDTAEVIANAEVAIQLNAVSGAYPGEGINVPQVIDLVPIQFARPGQVDVQVSIDEEPAGDLSFWLLPAAGQPVELPGSGRARYLRRRSAPIPGRQGRRPTRS